jgi:hypothetical protein
VRVVASTACTVYPYSFLNAYPYTLYTVYPYSFLNAVDSYEDIVDAFLQCVDCVCGAHFVAQQKLLRPVVVKCLAGLLMQECEDMYAACAPLTLETAVTLCSRMALLRGRLMLEEQEGGTRPCGVFL